MLDLEVFCLKFIRVNYASLKYKGKINLRVDDHVEDTPFSRITFPQLSQSRQEKDKLVLSILVKCVAGSLIDAKLEQWTPLSTFYST